MPALPELKPAPVVVGMMGHRLDGHDVSRYDGDKRCEVLAEVAPVHRLVGRGKVIVADGMALEMGLRMDECRGVDAARAAVLTRASWMLYGVLWLSMP